MTLPTFVPTGERRVPRAGDWYAMGPGALFRAERDHISEAQDIYRAITPEPEPRVIEQDGKRWRFVGRRRAKVGEWFVAKSGFVFEIGRLFRCEGRHLGESDIYELIQEQTMKVTHEEPGGDPYDTSIADMATGRYGIDKTGNYFLRTATSASCLNEPCLSYSGSTTNTARERKVRLLPPGTVITIVVE